LEGVGSAEPQKTATRPHRLSNGGVVSLRRRRHNPKRNNGKIKLSR
jgi:hypothetical protein